MGGGWFTNCGRREQMSAEACHYCEAPATRWCDFTWLEMPQPAGADAVEGLPTIRKQTSTIRYCDRPVCDRHGERVGVWFDMEGPGTTDTYDHCRLHFDGRCQ